METGVIESEVGAGISFLFHAEALPPLGSFRPPLPAAADADG